MSLTARQDVQNTDMKTTFDATVTLTTPGKLFRKTESC